PLDVMGVQMSGASWHPVRYEYDEVERERIATIKRIGKFKAVTRLVRQVQPRLVMPYAGPPCFLDDELFELNSGLRPGGIFPDQGEALAWLADRIPTQHGVCLLPGDRILLQDLSVIRDPHWSGFALDAGPQERRRYLQEYADRRRPAIDAAWATNPEPQPGLAERFKNHLESLGTLSEYFLARIGMTLRFDVVGANGGLWDAHIGPDRVRVDLDGGDGHADYRLTMDGRWLDGVVSGRTRWEELLLSLRFTARRQPDRYNDYLVGLLKHADRAALRAVEMFEAARDPRETTEITAGGRQLRVNRYCPHAGEDLAETGVVVNGVLRCLGHNFEFDLTSGKCLNARCDPIVVRAAGENYEDEAV
ncbi:MAG TPA: Rieske 2Fe-2S domain-containing protein, partial [Kribbella sp.]